MEDALRAIEIVFNSLAMKSLNPYSDGRYSKRCARRSVGESVEQVLILILMEDTLRDMQQVRLKLSISVLILVLMEDALRGDWRACNDSGCGVLILILMEDDLRVFLRAEKMEKQKS